MASRSAPESLTRASRVAIRSVGSLPAGICVSYARFACGAPACVFEDVIQQQESGNRNPSRFCRMPLAIENTVLYNEATEKCSILLGFILEEP